jgi:hypothetical protein
MSIEWFPESEPRRTIRPIVTRMPWGEANAILEAMGEGRRLDHPDDLNLVACGYKAAGVGWNRKRQEPEAAELTIYYEERKPR